MVRPRASNKLIMWSLLINSTNVKFPVTKCTSENRAIKAETKYVFFPYNHFKTGYLPNAIKVVSFFCRWGEEKAGEFRPFPEVSKSPVHRRLEKKIRTNRLYLT